MDAKKVVAVGASIILSSVVLYYVFSSRKRKKPKSRPRQLIEALRLDKDIREVEGVEIASTLSSSTSKSGTQPEEHSDLNPLKDVRDASRKDDMDADDVRVNRAEKMAEQASFEPFEYENKYEISSNGLATQHVENSNTAVSEGMSEKNTSIPNVSQVQHNDNLAAANCVSDATPPSELTQKIIDNEIHGGIPSSHEIIKTTAMATTTFEQQQRAKESTREYFEQCFNIPTRAVGKIIGREGNTIKTIQKTSGARLKFASNTRDKSKPFQKLFVKGNIRQIEDAVFQLIRTLPSDTQCYDLVDWNPDKALTGKLRAVDLFENTTFVGRVTHVESPESFWIQVCRGHDNIDYHEMLSNLTDNMTETLSRKKYDIRECLLSPQDIGPGASCAVMLDGRCWRGTVVKPGSPDNEVHLVRLVDFGTCDTFTELYKLNSYYLTMPMLAVRCSLAHVSLMEEDKVWPPHASTYLEEKLRHGFVKAKVISTSQNIYSVEMYFQDSDNESLYMNRELVLEGYARWDESVQCGS